MSKSTSNAAEKRYGPFVIIIMLVNVVALLLGFNGSIPWLASIVTQLLGVVIMFVLLTLMFIRWHGNEQKELQESSTKP
jgi:flagellar basal body-associated protein FliL